MAAELSPLSLTSYYDPFDGSVLTAKLFFYKAGTQDPVTVHTDSSLGIPHAQPVLTGGSGRVPPVWIGFPTPYRVRTFDQYDTLLEDIDNLPGAEGVIDPDEPPVDGDGSLPPPGSELDLLLNKRLNKTGDMFPAFTNSLGLGDRAVRANGQTIGDALSAATERANDDCHDLYIFLWGQDVSKLLVIEEGTTGSAQGDWDAHRRLTLPDLRGRSIMGLDKMGNTNSSGRFTNGLVSDAAQINSPGSSGGLAYHVLTEAQLASHNHAVNDPTHNHTIYDPGHDHGIGDPWHNHALGDPTHHHIGEQLTPAGYAAAGSAGAKDAFRSTNQYTDYRATGMTIGAINTGVVVYGKVTGVYNGAIATGIWNSATGGGALHNNLQPYLSLCWYIHL